MITVFYDGKCGLCSREISYYRKIAPKGVFDWQDITESDEKLKQVGISLVDGLKSLHSLDEKGQLYTGVDTFILIWKQLKYWRFLAVLINLPGIRQLSDFIYKIFAKWRFKRLKHCQIAEKQFPKA